MTQLRVAHLITAAYAYFSAAFVVAFFLQARSMTSDMGLAGILLFEGTTAVFWLGWEI